MRFRAALPASYFDLFGNGFWNDAGNGLGIVFGVLTTQIYVQAVLSGRDVRQSRLARSWLASAPRCSGWAVSQSGCLCASMNRTLSRPRRCRCSRRITSPRAQRHHAWRDPDYGDHLRRWAGAGHRHYDHADLYQPYIRPQLGDREGILVARTTIVVIVILGVLTGGSDLLTLIISYSFLAFAFRADSLLIPVMVAAIGPRLRLNTAGAGVGALAAAWSPTSSGTLWFLRAVPPSSSAWGEV